MYFIKQKILHNLYLPTTSYNLRLMTSKLGQWRLLKPTVIITATIKFVVDLMSVIESPLLFEINAFYFVILKHKTTSGKKYEKSQKCP